jgi:hypothetical protein
MLAAVAVVFGTVGCGAPVAPLGGNPPGGGGGGGGNALVPGTNGASGFIADDRSAVGGFTPGDFQSSGYALNIPRQEVFLPSLIRQPRQVGIQLVNEFGHWPILLDNGVLRSTVTGSTPEHTGAVHFRHSLYDVYLGMVVQVDPGFPNAMTLILRHHVIPSTYGTRPHCYVGCRLNTVANRLEVIEDIGGVVHLRGFRPIQSLSGTLEAIAYKSNFGCYFNGQFAGVSYSQQFQQHNERNALYGVTGQSFRAARAIVANLYEASRRTEIPWFVDNFDRNQFGAAGSNYMTTANTSLLVSGGVLRSTASGVRAPVWLEGTGHMRSQDVRADIQVGNFGQAGVISHYVAGRGGYAAFVDCNGSCAIRTGYLNQTNVFTEAQSVPFNGPDYPSVGFGFQGRARVRMTTVRNQSGVFQINVYLNEQLVLSFRPARTWENGHSGAYVGNDGAIDALTLADHSQ